MCCRSSRRGLHDIEVVTADDFGQARRLIESDNFHLALLDIMGVNGFELLKACTERKLPAAMLTARAITIDSVNLSLKLGAVSFLPKDELKNIRNLWLRSWKGLNRERPIGRSFSSDWGHSLKKNSEYSGSARKSKPSRPSHTVRLRKPTRRVSTCRANARLAVRSYIHLIETPITRSGNHVTTPGKTQIKTTAKNHEPDERHDAPHHGTQGDIRRDVSDYEYVQPNWWVNESHLHHYSHDHAEPDQVKPDSLQRRQNDRSGHKDNGHWRQKETKHAPQRTRIAASRSMGQSWPRSIRPPTG